MRTLFKCGHKGKGKFCHRCDQAVTLVDQAKAEKVGDKAVALNLRAAALFLVPKRVDTTVQMPSDPVPA